MEDILILVHLGGWCNAKLMGISHDCMGMKEFHFLIAPFIRLMSAKHLSDAKGCNVDVSCPVVYCLHLGG